MCCCRMYVYVVVEWARVEPLSLSEAFLILAGQNCGDAAADKVTVSSVHYYVCSTFNLYSDVITDLLHI